tara:strand:- start:2516 stop:3667 length:1152 start_codon:yes stop_codon:yes gene_type:complete
MRYSKLMMVLVGLMVLTLGTSFVSAQEKGKELQAKFQVEGKWFGLPEAELFTEDYDGPPVVGEYVTMLPNIATLPKGNRVHHVRMDILAQEIEVAEGVRYVAWTFGGTVPGPVLHVREGDKVVFTMKNRSDEAVDITAPMKGNAPFLQQLAMSKLQKPVGDEMPMMHSIDFHSGTVAADDKWRAVPPGMSVRFEWIANYPGVHIYHCGVPPVLQHMSMGQYGMVIVSPKEGYPTDNSVDKEFAVVQSEFYLKKEEGSDLYVLDFDAADEKRPSIVAFNGHQSALMDNPMEVEVGDRVRIYMLNVGPNDVSSTHVIGAIFDRVWYEGNLKNEMHGMQTVLLGSSNGAVLEFIVSEEGHYVLVDHEMADMQKGAAGLFIAKPKSK